jgi:hypothetical protein
LSAGGFRDPDSDRRRTEPDDLDQAVTIDDCNRGVARLPEKGDERVVREWGTSRVESSSFELQRIGQAQVE